MHVQMSCMNSSCSQYMRFRYIKLLSLEAVFYIQKNATKMMSAGQSNKMPVKSLRLMALVMVG